jgi:hypothetical protein
MADHAVPEPAPPAAQCLNCGEPFAAGRPKFCPGCGQETTLQPPTLLEFAQQFGGAYLSTEGALWRTLRLLLFRPGELTRQYLSGRRKHYVLPLRLYLTISVTALLVMRLTGGLTASSIDDPKVVEALKNKPPVMTVDLGLGRARLKDGVFSCENLPQWLCRRLQARLVLEPKAMIEEVHTIQDRMASNWGAVMFVLMPAFALGLAALYRNRRLRYTEHLVFALHLHAFWFIALLCMRVGGGVVTFAGLLAIPVYGVLAMRRVYGGRWLPRKGFCDKTRGQLVEELCEAAGDLGAVIGDPNPDAGAWVRVNPLDGRGVKDAFVSAGLSFGF